jgi:hypothetical protein
VLRFFVTITERAGDRQSEQKDAAPLPFTTCQSTIPSNLSAQDEKALQNPQTPQESKCLNRK